MLYEVLADTLVIIHAAFIVFVVFGGILVWRWRSMIWLHVPAMIWGVIVSITPLFCPLTPWENHLRRLAGDGGYDTGFIEHYLVPLIYPAGLTLEIQFVLAAFVVVVNAAIYSRLCLRR